MLTPMIGLVGRGANRLSRSATAAAPSLLKPSRFTMAWSATSRCRRGRALPGCGTAVTVPTSTNPKPSAANASAARAFLSNPAARPSGLGKSQPSARTRNRASSTTHCRRSIAAPPGTRAATRIAAVPASCARSASIRARTASNSARYSEPPSLSRSTVRTLRDSPASRRLLRPVDLVAAGVIAGPAGELQPRTAESGRRGCRSGSPRSPAPPRQDPARW